MHRLDGLVQVYQSHWMAENTQHTRASQWRHYMQFCDLFGFCYLPADEVQVSRYLVYMADNFVYSSIQNYLSALWAFHKVNGYECEAKGSFSINMTLRGIRRLLGDIKVQAVPITVNDLQKMFCILNMEESEDIVFWLSCLIAFRGLVRRSNLFGDGMCFKYCDVSLASWGLILVANKTKTIQYKERSIHVILSTIKFSEFCARKYAVLLMALVLYPNPHVPFLAYMKNGVFIKCTFDWFGKKLDGICKSLNLSHFTLHSFRRGGATALSELGVSLSDIKAIGDWKSLSVLDYLDRSNESRFRLDQRVSSMLFTDV